MPLPSMSCAARSCNDALAVDSSCCDPPVAWAREGRGREVECSGMTEQHDLTHLLNDARDGDRAANDALMERVYSELQVIAAAQMRRERANHTLQPTALVNEAYMRLVVGDQPWESRTHFFGAASRAIRQILVDHARGRGRKKRGGDRHPVQLSDSVAGADGDVVDLIAIDDALAELARLNARHAKVVEMRFFGGLTMPEIAEALDVSLRTVEGDWAVARLWLSRALGDTTP